MQKANFKTNLDKIISFCGLDKPFKREEDKNDDKNNIDMITIEVDNCVREICDRIKVFK